MTDLVIRPLTAGEEHLFDSLNDPGLVGRSLLGQNYSAMAATGDYRPEWTWVALREGTVVARAAWWAGPDDDAPVVLDWFDFTDGDAAIQLLCTAPFHVEYSLVLPPGWRDNQETERAARTRLDAATAAGLTFLVERYRYCWTPACGLPERPNRLHYQPEPDDTTMLDLFRRVHHNTLDAHARHTIATTGPEAAAREDLDLLIWLPSPRHWWQLAYNETNELVGFAIPARNHTGPIIGYIGVLPEHRGHGYAYELLAEATHRLAGEGATAIVAATDTTNTPMAAAFAKAKYPITQHRIDMI